MENKAHALAAGAFVLGVSALLIALAVWLTRQAGEVRYYEVATRSAVTGLQSQAGVQYRGVRVGKVASIAFDPSSPGQVLLRLELDADAPVTRSTYATLGYQGLTGIAFVQLDDEG
ncbi:MAG: MlaD family protein, partial [Curvibacter sp.]